MNILIIGSGGREHALAWKAAEDTQVAQVFAAPGNPGMEQDNKISCIDIAVNQFDKLLQFAQENDILLTMVGPEAPLVEGIVDYFTAHGQACFGPSAKAARLEGSKIFAKQFLQKNQIPTANYAEFTNYQAAYTYAQTISLPIVIKADGLAAGKGVFIAHTLSQVQTSLESIFTHKDFGDAGDKIIIEDFIVGEELSFMIATDGTNYKYFANSQDHKHIGEGDTGQNTGGMGAYSPTTLVTAELEEKIDKQIIQPTLAGMRDDGTPFIGFLYFGLMIDKHNNPYVLEYNVRLGDPETQVIMARLESSLVDLCQACLTNSLAQHTPTWSVDTAIGVVMAAGGYPQNYPKGNIIDLNKFEQNKDIKLFFAGVKKNDKNFITNGGRVLCITAKDKNIQLAQTKVYAAVKNIEFSQAYYRRDIGFKEIKRLNQG